MQHFILRRWKMQNAPPENAAQQTMIWTCINVAPLVAVMSDASRQLVPVCIIE